MKLEHSIFKRSVSIILCFVMLLSVFQAAVFAAPKSSGSDAQFGIDTAKEYVLYSFHVDCGSWFAPKADGSLRSLGANLDIPTQTDGLRWTFELVEGNEYQVSNGGVWLSIAGGKVVLSDKPASLWLAAEEDGDGFYLTDESGDYVLNTGYASGAHRLLAVKKTDSAARPFYIEETGDFYTESGALVGLLPEENFKATIVAPAGVTADTLVVIFAKGEDGKYYALNSTGKASAALGVGTLAEKEIITSPDADVLWSVISRMDGNITADKGLPLQRYFRSAVEKDGHYLVAGDKGILSALNGDSNLNAITGEDGLSFTLISDDDADGNNKCIVFKNGEFAVSDDVENATTFYFAKLMNNQLEDSGVTAQIPDGTLLKVVKWSDVKADGKTRYALILAAEFNYAHYALSGNGRFASSTVINITDDWDSHTEADWDEVSYRTTEPCLFQPGDYLHTIGENVLWTVAQRNGGYVFQNVGTSLYLAPDNGPNKSQTPAIAPTPARLTVQPSGNLIYLSKDGNYLDFWKYIAVSDEGMDGVTDAFFIAELVGEDDLLTTPVPDGTEDEFYFGGAYSIYQDSQHSLSDGSWYGTGVGAYLLMKSGSGNFAPAPDGSNYDITFCADWDAYMPVNIGELVKFNRVSIDDDAANDAQGRFTPEQRAQLKAMAPLAYPYVSAGQMLAAMEKAGYQVSQYCGADEMLTGFQAAIYTVTNPREDGEPWSYFGSNIAHGNREVNRSESYIADPAIAESDVNTIRDYLLAAAAESGIQALDLDEDPAGTEVTPYTLNDYKAKATVNGNTYSVTFTGTLNQPVREGDVVRLWFYYDGCEEQSWIQLEAGETEINWTVKDVPNDVEYTFAISYLMPYYDVYLYYPEDGEDNVPGWQVWQMQIGVMNKCSYAEYFHNSISLNVTKNWTDGEPKDIDSVKADLIEILGEDQIVVDTIDITKTNEWKGVFAHVPYQQWTFEIYNADENNQPEFMLPGSEYNYVIGQSEQEQIELGTHSYTVKEQPVNGYDSTVEGDELDFTITNTMQRGDLTVSKTLEAQDYTGAQRELTDEEKSQEFTFTVTLGDNTLNGTYGDMTFKDGVASFTLKHGESKTAKGLPADVTYTVTEEETDGYTASSANESGKIVKEENVTAAFVNSKKDPTPGALTVSKVVTGKDGDPNREFTFVVTLEDASVNGTYGDMTFKDGVATFTLKHGESKIALGLPEGIGFTVKEQLPDGDFSYQATWTVDGAVVAKGWDVSASGVTPGEFSEVVVIAENSKIQTGGLIVTNVIHEKNEDVIDTDKEFDITIDFFEGDLDGDGKYTEKDRGIADTISGVFNITRNDGTKETIHVVNGKAKISMKHNESVVIEGLPEGLHYLITEAQDFNGEYTGMDKNTGAVLTSDDSNGISGVIPANDYAQEDIVNVRLSFITVSKTVSGEGADKNFAFEFTLELDDKDINGTYGDLTFKDGVASFTLKHGETKKADGLPVGTGYTVTEKEYTGYEVEYTGRTGFVAEDGSKVTVENKFKAEPTPEPIPEPEPPETADNGNLWMWIGFMTMSVLGLLVTGVSVVKSKMQF